MARPRGLSRRGADRERERRWASTSTDELAFESAPAAAATACRAGLAGAEATERTAAALVLAAAPALRADEGAPGSRKKTS
eukprot:15435590-Alexandrium_andersonii.AAC.1